MKLLLTSSGISNKSIQHALLDLLGKPINECTALFIPTAIYPFPNGTNMAWQAICGKTKSQLCQLDWKSLGVLELTALPSIEKKIWIGDLQNADVLLVWGGDVLFLSYWMQQSGLAEELPSLLQKLVYVGVSAGSMAVCSTIGETYSNHPAGSIKPLTSEKIVFSTPEGELNKFFYTARGAGLVDFALIPHFENIKFPDTSRVNAEKWAAKIPAPVYAIDDQTAIKVVNGKVEVVSEGSWKLFTP
jgi:dipeptidase E